jgi:hypothetical protein
VAKLVSGNNADNAAVPEQSHSEALETCYLSYFDLFNRQRFFEAHEVLEELWLPCRNGPKGPFYKGLIQLAGAFVHVQKGRYVPAVALLKLARANLVKYPARYEALEVHTLQQTISGWLTYTERSLLELGETQPPKLFLNVEAKTSGGSESPTSHAERVDL